MGLATIPQPSIAVLPFRMLSTQEADRYLAEGMVHDVVASLAGLQELFVIPSSSSLGFAESQSDAVTFGRQLAVPYLVSGSLPRPRPPLPLSPYPSQPQPRRA